VERTDGPATRTGPRLRRLPWILIVAIYAALAVAAPVKILAKRAKTSTVTQGTTVKMAGLEFSPATLAVRRGTAVLFDNNDVAPHTVTADSGATDSGILSPGKSFRLVVSDRFVYHCAVHPFMKATIDILG
jgi:plastocyanin